jgi:hypothetical protein
MEHRDVIEGVVVSTEEAKKASINELLQRL